MATSGDRDMAGTNTTKLILSLVGAFAFVIVVLLVSCGVIGGTGTTS